MVVEMIDPQRQLLDEIADTRMTRDDVALTYAFAIRQSVARQSARVDWTAVNHAIVERWSLSALKYIKRSAWRKVEPENWS
jgi:hypothetical protein